MSKVPMFQKIAERQLFNGEEQNGRIKELETRKQPVV